MQDNTLVKIALSLFVVNLAVSVITLGCIVAAMLAILELPR